METKWLEDFLSLARTSNFSRSADERFVTQPAFSRRIKALEVWAGSSLINRDTYPIELTAAGHVFKGVAEEVLRNLYNCRDELNSIDQSSAEKIIVCTGQALSLAFIPQWLVSIREKLGSVRIRIVPDNLNECVQTLIRGDCDFMLTFAHPSVPVLLDQDQYPYRVVGIDRLVPVSAVNGEGKLAFELPGSDKQPLPYLAYPAGIFLGRIVEAILQDIGTDMHLQHSFENPMAEGLKYMAMQGHGIAWLPESSITHEIELNRLAITGDAGTQAALEIRFYRARELHKNVSLALWEMLS